MVDSDTLTGVDRPDLDAALLTDVLETVLEFGPRRSIPVPVRVREAHPDASDDAVERAIALAHQVEQRAYELTEAGWPEGSRMSDAEFRAVTAAARRTLESEFPSIGTDALGHALSQAHYWHFHG